MKLNAILFFSEIQELKNKPARVYDKVSSLIGQLFSVYNPTESSGTLVDMFTNTTNDIAKCYQTYSSDCKYLENIIFTISLRKKCINK